jgi:AcrR family transcriptional regulator
MGKPRHTTRRYEDSQSAVVAAAIGELNRKGVSRMTLADVAARLGFAAPTVTYYFRKKEDLAAACLMQGLKRLCEFIAAAEAGSDARARVELLMSAYFEFKRRSVLGEVEEFPAFSDARGLNLESLNAAYGEMFRRLRGLLTGTGSPTLQRLEVNCAAHYLLAQLHWAPLWLRNIYPEDYARFGGRVFSIVADGLATPGAGWHPANMPTLLPALEPSDGATFEMFLRAASAQINEQGYRGTSVDRIAARLNLTKGAFYHHIKTKDELVMACFERTFEVMRQAIRSAETASSSGQQTLATLTIALAEHQISGDAPLLRASAMNTVLESSKTAIVNQISRISTRIGSIISDGIADGSLRRIDANVGAHMIIGLINNADELPHFARGVSPRATAEAYVRPLFEGLLPRTDADRGNQHVDSL